jgi:2,3-dihydroxybiphenyl 1,2-dioxygenase
MDNAMKLGYLVVETARARAWREFCDRMLGLPGPCENPDGSEGYRLDGASQRFILVPGTRDDLLAVGLEFASEAGLERCIERVASSGVFVEEASAALRASRRVGRLVRFKDPAGNWIELFTRLELAQTPFESKAFPSGFEVGDLGIGHAALICRDVALAEQFYIDVLGFGVSERLHTRIGGFDVRGVFLHCNRRHHSLALFNLPLRRRLHHFMMQAHDFNSVGRAFERAQQLRVPLSLSLGQHADPDGTFSFYGVTPSGFEFEVGAGSHEIDPATFVAVQSDTPSTWGHKPTARLKFQTLGGIIAAHAQKAFGSFG